MSSAPFPTLLAGTTGRPRLTIRETHRVLRLARGGRLQPWLGPALRGLAGGRLRARVCRQPVAEQIGRWARCAGCPQMAGCAYGETYEPDPPDRPPGGWTDVARPLVIAPAYPVPEWGRPGDRLAVRVVFLGAQAATHIEAFWHALQTAGADPLLGLGEDRVLFDVLPGAEPDRGLEVELPEDPTTVAGVVPRVRVELTSPLVLTACDAGGRKELVRRPTFGDLMRAGLRVLGPVFRRYGRALPEPTFAQVKGLAMAVASLRGDFREVSQVKSSHRTGDRWVVRGVVGWGEYGPVPAGLLPWLDWAGRLHVGTHRVAGAGGWRVEVGHAGA